MASSSSRYSGPASVKRSGAVGVATVSASSPPSARSSEQSHLIAGQPQRGRRLAVDQEEDSDVDERYEHERQENRQERTMRGAGKCGGRGGHAGQLDGGKGRVNRPWGGAWPTCTGLAD